MKKLTIVKCVLLLLLLVEVRSPAWAQIRVGPLEITGNYQITIQPSLGDENPNNERLLKNAGAPRFLLGREFIDLNIRAKITDELTATFEPRFFHDFTSWIDSHYRNYDAFPASFSGDGNLLQASGNKFKAELWQAYIDYKKGNLWLRLGKQQIAWGESIALRVLDVVNPLDVSQFFFFDRAYEEFERIRIPQWFIRGSYTIPNKLIPDFNLELLVNPGAVDPTILPAQGAPYNVIPSILKFYDHVEQGRPTAGGRLTGTLGGVQSSLNYLTKPNDDPVGLPKGLVADPSGLPLLFGFGDPTPYRIKFVGEHPRVNIFGGSMNYSWAWAGAVLRMETTYTPDAPFEKGPDPNTLTSITDRPVVKTMFAVDRPITFIPGLDPLSITFQFLETYTGGHLRNAFSSGATVDHWVQLFTLFLGQPLFRKTVTLECLGIYDTDGGYWIQPGIHWEVDGNHMRADLYANLFGGKDESARRRFPGQFYWANGIFARFTYGF